MINPRDYKFRKFIYNKNIEKICDFHKEHIKINFPGSKFKKQIFKKQVKEAYKKEPKGMWVLTDKNGKIVGFLWLQTKMDVYKDTYYGDVHYVHVAPELRKQGLGKMLMKKTEEYFSKNKKITEYRLGTHVDNKAAYNLYKKFGYSPIRVMMIKKI